MTQWFPVRNVAEGVDYKEARLKVSLKVKRVMALENQESFWGLLKADQPKTASGHHNVADEEAEILRKVFPHVRPILSNTLRLLYLVVCPVMKLLLWHRRILVDWEKV